MGEPGSRGSEGCQVLAFIPNKMLSFSWNAPPSMPEVRNQYHFVVIFFEEIDAKRTRVILRDSGFGEGEAWSKCYEYFNAAWGVVMERLVERFEKGPRDRSETRD